MLTAAGLSACTGRFSEEQLAERVANRLSGANVAIDVAQAAAVVALAKAHACRS